MHAIYAFVAGPLAWAAFLLFFGGLLMRVVQLLVRVNKTEKFIFTYMSWKYSLRSIFHWIIPFGTVNWRRHPALTVVTFLFHICLLAAPIFLLAHMVLVDEAWWLSWWTLPDGAADAMTLIVIAGCLFFLIRRLTRPEVAFVTDASDYILLIVVAAPFVTGFLSYHQWLGRALDNHFAHVQRRSHAGRDPVYAAQSYDLLGFHPGLHGVRNSGRCDMPGIGSGAVTMACTNFKEWR